MPDLMSKPIRERFEHLLATISSERFLHMQGLGNEVPFFICPFDPKEHDEMSKLYGQLVNQLEKKGIPVLIVNLYNLTIEILKKRGIWEQILESEKSMTKGELKELLQSVLDPEHNLIPAIAEKMKQKEFDVMFLTGIGEVFPYIRSHTVLNNLQSIAKEKPTIMFFPGEFSQSSEKGSSLNLFGKLLDDNYYRAFDIYKHFQPRGNNP
jgi:hypothetical protein